MKKQLTFLAFSVLLFTGKMAAQFSPIPSTGYTLDAVAEFTPAASSTGGVIDGSNYVLYSAAYGTMMGTTYGLPNSGIVSSGTRTFQLRPYNTANMLYIPYSVATPTISRDSITITNPSPFLAVSLLGFSTEGTSSMSVSVRFTDNTTQAFTGLSLADWFTTGNTVISGFDRASRNLNTPDFNGTNPKMFYTDLAIACANQGKYVKRIIIQNLGNGTGAPRVCIMAVSGTNPPYTATANTYSTCGAGTVTLTATGMTTYTWQPVGSFAGANTTTAVVSPTSITTYTLDGSVTTGTNTCPGSTMITIYGATGVPTIGFSGTTPTVCLGSAATLSASGAITYTFNNSVANGGTFTPASTANYTVTGANACGTSTAQTTITVTPLPVTAVSLNTLICAGAASTLTAGGAASFTWTPGTSTLTNFIVNPTANTVYTLTGLNPGNCTGSTTIAINTKPNPTLTIVPSSSAICSGNSATLTINGNAASYSWTPTGQTGTLIVVSPSTLTLYSAIATSTGNCVTTVGQAISVNNNPTITATASNYLVCTGGTSTLSASGASTYVWTNNSATTNTTAVTLTTDDTFTVTGTSSVGCVTSTVVPVGVFMPTISVTSNTAICKGSGVTIGADIADAWQWSNGQTTQNVPVSPTLTTVYSLTAMVNNLNGLSCPATNTVQVTVNANPTVTAASNHPTICVGQSAILTADGAATYTWTGGPSVVQSTSINVSPISTQNYTVSGIDANGCKGKGVFSLVVSPCTGISVNSASTDNLLVYPNPNNGSFTISYEQTITLNIINELGQQVGSVKLDDSNNHQASIDSLPAGIYFVKSADASHTITQKIVIAK